MSSKIKTLVLAWILFLIVGTALSQVTERYHSIDSLPEYKIFNPEIKKAVDELMLYTEDCMYYKALNKPYLIWLCIYDTSMLSIESIPYSCTSILNNRSDSRTKEEGLCYYEGYSIFIQSFVSNYIHNFFQSSGEEKNLRYNNSDNHLDHIRSAYESVEIFYDIINGKLVMHEDDISLCRNDYYFHYMIQAGDSWSDIAEKCGCSIKDLKNEYPELETPITGYLLTIKYHFENGKLIGIERTP